MQHFPSYVNAPLSFFPQVCSYPDDSGGDEDAVLPQRLQTAMSLYSNNLCGMVLLTEDHGATGDGGATARDGFV